MRPRRALDPAPDGSSHENSRSRAVLCARSACIHAVNVNLSATAALFAADHPETYEED